MSLYQLSVFLASCLFDGLLLCVGFCLLYVRLLLVDNQTLLEMEFPIGDIIKDLNSYDGTQTDENGNVIQSFDNTVRRQVVSESVCQTVAKILEEGVSGNGGAKNAYVAGYRLAAKTGTSEKKERECPLCGYTATPATIEGVGMFVCTVCQYTGTPSEFKVSEKYVCSTVAFAPADDPQYAIIIMVDEPTEGTLYGSVVAAPYVANVMETILPYLGVEAFYTEKELENSIKLVLPSPHLYISQQIREIENDIYFKGDIMGGGKIKRKNGKSIAPQGFYIT